MALNCPDFYQNCQQIVLGQPFNIVILDGHHRVRFAPIFHIFEIPALVITLEQATQLYNSSPEGFVQQLERSMAETLLSFQRRRPDLPPPLPVIFTHQEGNFLTADFMINNP